MNHYLFNGDADGIISLYQYRTIHPDDDPELHTGVKRDVKLLRHVTDVTDCKITVFDISLLSNHEHANQLLQQDNTIQWFDHHEPGDPIDHKNLQTYIDTNPNTCTSVLVDQHIGGVLRPWTICAAYGDNLHDTARELNTCFDDYSLYKLQEIGETLNYNGYGQTEDDLVAHPLDVYLDMKQYETPFEYRAESSLYQTMHAQKTSDQRELDSSEILHECEAGQIILLPDTQASVRYSGIYSNSKCTSEPDKAFAILTTVEGGYRVSIRAPKNNPTGASQLALQFETGGGREKAAGINLLQQSDLQQFKDIFETNWNNF